MEYDFKNTEALWCSIENIMAHTNYLIAERVKKLCTSNNNSHGLVY